MSYFKFQQWFLEKKHKLHTRLVRRSFGAMGRDCIVQATMRCTNPGDIFLGDRVFIGADAWIDCFKEYPFSGQQFTPRLEIGADTMIGYHSHIMVVGHMKIGRHVLIADRVYISDNLHGYEDVTKPMLAQPLVHRPVEIQDEVWLGENVCVLPGVTIGRHSVIGSNSVVTKDVPPHSVAAGVPARVLRTYDPRTAQWIRA
ncbi:MAG: acyltransferase [Verrucomicrobia bacterium]|jgi:acetyltransferase-like isoleucine patch superfamily enzyme|nr:acyltransferase [Verrucomicrobiota bacterium]